MNIAEVLARVEGCDGLGPRTVGRGHHDVDALAPVGEVVGQRLVDRPPGSRVAVPEVAQTRILQPVRFDRLD